jgi:ketosteroid isomerase-like protein
MKKAMFATPQDAEAAFYEAFTSGDLDAMMAVWADDDDIYCVHPNGARASGVEEVRESWRRIFASGQSLRFQIRDEQCTQHMMLAVHSVYEHITVAGDPRQASAVIATNVYVRTARGWRMLAHHASPAPAPARAEPSERRAGPKTLH